MKTIREYIKENPYYRRPTVMAWDKIDTLVLHSTGDAVPSAIKHVRYYNSRERDVAVHAFIDGYTGVAYEVMPYNYKGAHAGAGGINSHSIGVEMCEPDGFKYSGGATVGLVINRTRCIDTIRRTYESAVEYFAYLIVDVGLKIKNIYGHGELKKLGLSVSTHVDPEHLWKQFRTGYSMNSFRADVWDLVERKRDKVGVVYDTIESVPNVYRGTIRKLINLGLLNGYEGGLGLTSDMCRIFTVLDRGGLFDGREKNG